MVSGQILASYLTDVEYNQRICTKTLIKLASANIEAKRRWEQYDEGARQTRKQAETIALPVAKRRAEGMGEAFSRGATEEF